MHNQKAEPSNALCAGVYVALLVLLGATVAIAEVEIGRLALVAAVGIATLKAILILLVFMRVLYGTPLLRLLASAGFVWLLLLFLLSLSDYFTRV